MSRRIVHRFGRARNGSACARTMAAAAAASASPSPAGGRWSALMTCSGMASSASGGSPPWSWTASRPIRAAMAAPRPLSVGEDAHEPRTVAGRGGQPRQSDQGRDLRFGQGAPGAGYHVQADGVRAGRDGGSKTTRLGDATDLDHRQPAVRGRVLPGARHGARRDERSDPCGHGGRVGAGTHQVLTDEGGVEAERTPATQQRRLADTRTQR